MAVPKRKTPRSRRNSRRAANSKAPITSLSSCANCGEVKIPHRVCNNCGYYRGLDVLRIEKE